MLKFVWPNQFFDIKGFEAEIKKVLDDCADGALQDFNATTNEWETKVQFEITEPNDGTRIVSTDNEIYGYVNDGTRPHTITAKTSKGLVFAPGGSPKTQPGLLTSGKGSRGNQWVRKQSVQHPGAKPRDFDVSVAKKWQPIFSAKIKAALKRATKP